MKYVVQYCLPKRNRFYYLESFDFAVKGSKPKGLDYRPYNSFFNRVLVFDCIKDAAIVVKALKSLSYSAIIRPLSFFLSDRCFYNLSRENVDLLHKLIASSTEKVECCPLLEPECRFGCDFSHPGCPLKLKGADQDDQV